MTPLPPQRLFPCPPRGLPVRRALLLQEATVVCKATSHNSALLATDEPTPCADAATCFHEHFQDFPLGLHNWAGCWILSSCDGKAKYLCVCISKSPINHQDVTLQKAQERLLLPHRHECCKETCCTLCCCHVGVCGGWTKSKAAWLGSLCLLLTTREYQMVAHPPL